MDTREGGGLAGLRQLRSALKVAAVGNVSRAARILGRSQTAVSKSLSQLEQGLGVALFTRAPDGLRPTAAGEVALRRFATVEALFAAAAAEYEAFHRRPRALASIPLFTMDIALKRLRQVVALHDNASLDEASASLGVSASTIYKSLHELEVHLDAPLFARLPGGRFVAVEYGRMLLPRIKLALGEIERTVDELAHLRGEARGRIAIGCTPATTAHIVPAALTALLDRHPDIRACTHEGPYHELVEMLCSGELDVLVGGLRPAEHRTALSHERLVHDRICILARPGHPLVGRTDLAARDFAGARWVLPRWRCSSPPLFEAALAEAGITFDVPIIENASVVALNGLLRSSDFLTVGTLLQAHADAGSAGLAVVPFRLTSDDWPSGILSRRDTLPSAAARLFMSEARAVFAQVGCELGLTTPLRLVVPEVDAGKVASGARRPDEASHGRLANGQRDRARVNWTGG